MTYFGINPSFVNGRLPLFSNGIQRDRYFRVFNERGEPTQEKSEIAPDGWPMRDGRLHGVKVFSEMAGTMPQCAAQLADSSALIRQREGEMFWIASRSWSPSDTVKVSGPRFRSWHIPSLSELSALKPTVLRTLDWERTNDKRDWSRPRVTPAWPTQGDGMAVELQAEAANLLKCNLWWCAPPRFELSTTEYEAKLEEMLRALQATANRPLVLQYGNELWNSGFAVHGWLERMARETDSGWTWHQQAAQEISLLKKVADKVFGTLGPFGPRYFLFVDGQFTVPSHLERILEALADLGIVPDMAGPALYATPLKASKEDWEANGTVPSQDELQRSVQARVREMWPLLDRTADIVSRAGVPYLGVYEAGQSLIAGHHPWRRAAIEAQRAEWMRGIYLQLRSMAQATGVTVLNWYSAMTDQQPGDTRVDVFGLLEGLGKPWLPKAGGAIGESA